MQTLLLNNQFQVARTRQHFLSSAPVGRSMDNNKPPCWVHHNLQHARHLLDPLRVSLCNVHKKSLKSQMPFIPLPTQKIAILECPRSKVHKRLSSPRSMTRLVSCTTTAHSTLLKHIRRAFLLLVSLLEGTATARCRTSAKLPV